MTLPARQAAQKSWRRLDGHHQLPRIIQLKFADGARGHRQTESTVSPKPSPHDPSGRHQDLAMLRSSKGVIRMAIYRQTPMVDPAGR